MSHPKATLEIYHKILATHTRIRIMGLVIALMGGAMILFAQDPQQTASWVLLWFGWYMVGVSILFLIVFTSYYKRFAEMILDLTESRVLGALGVGFGALFIWLGFRLM